MEMNLFRFVQNRRLMKKLNKMLDLQQTNQLRTFLFKYFPNQTLQGVNDDLIMEIGDVIASLSDAEGQPTRTKSEVHMEFNQLKQSLMTLKRHYANKKQSIIHHYRRISPAERQIPHTMKPAAIAQLSKIEKLDLLDRLDRFEAYESYLHGYHYEQNEIYTWLIYVIDESLNQHVHQTN